MLRCFASTFFFLKELHCHLDGFLLGSTSRSSLCKRRLVPQLHCPIESSASQSHHSPLPAMVAGASTMQWRFFLFFHLEKIIVHTADEFVHGLLFHPKCSAQKPRLSCSVWYSRLSRDRKRVPDRAPHGPGFRRPRAVTWAFHTS